MINKIITGFVVQHYDEKTGICTSQDFIAGDDVAWEDEYGEIVDQPKRHAYCQMIMVQPGEKEGMVC